jgi:hypothetical protein
MSVGVGLSAGLRMIKEYGGDAAVSISDKSMCSHPRDSSFARFSLLSSLIDLSFVYHLSFIPFQTRFGPFFIPFPAFLPPRKSSISERHLTYPNSILLFV